LTTSQESPTSYSVSLKGVGRPFAVFLAQPFHPSWRATVHVLDDSGKSIRSYEVAAAQHYRANGFANGWWIGDVGSLRIELTYEPQRMFSAAVLISLIVWVITAFAAMALGRSALLRLLRLLRAGCAIRFGRS
jgi:hypothetical protein